MKKFIVSILAIAMIVGMMVGCGKRMEIPEGEPLIRGEYPTEAPTEVPTEPHFPMKGVVLVDRLNVREEPDINHYVKYQLEVGEEIEVLEIKILDAIAWGRMENDMWVNLRYVDLEDENYDFTMQYDYNIDDLHGLAIVNYMEAGEDKCCNLCRARICDVVLNRIADDRWAGEDTVKEVLTSPTQFSYLWLYYGFPDRAERMQEQHAIERAYMIAEQILLGNHSDVYRQGYVWYQGINRTNDYIVCENCGIYYSR
jgi:hypothetical protein